MLRVIEHHPASSWPDDSAGDSLTLDFDNRHRRRIRLTTDSGAYVLLDLPKAVAMAHGDGLRLEDGSWLRVNAAPETLVEVHAVDATQLARIAWHIGNRHLPAQIMPRALRIRPDHVIEAMITGLGGVVTRVDAPFQPEGGAYGGQAMHGHGHSHDQGHAHDHGHEPQHHHDREHDHDAPRSHNHSHEH
jgi:urease accessory protein